MSLILEALRKSEAERRRGQAPGLFLEQIPVSAARRARTPAWAWWLGALLLAVLAAWAWREFGRALPGAVETTSGSDRGPGATSVPAIPETLPARGDAASAAAISGDPAVSVPPVAPSVAAAPARLPPVTPSPPAQFVAASPIETPPAAIPAPAATTTPAPPANGAVAAMDAAGPPTAPQETVPRLAELPASDRAQLPPLKLSMHVYTDDPAQRFVILDGKRLQEGASPAAGVVLEQIRRDGLVLSVNGRRVLLARP